MKQNSLIRERSEIYIFWFPLTAFFVADGPLGPSPVILHLCCCHKMAKGESVNFGIANVLPCSASDHPILMPADALLTRCS